MAKILIIDDDVSVRDTFAQLLTRKGHRVVVAENGREALRSHAADPVDLVITDIVMPEMDGIEIVGRLSRFKPSVPVIAMSGNTGQELYLHMAKALGAVHVLTKPFGAEVLLEAIERLVGAPVASPNGD